jgi:ubiquinone/menaquinone biosynthesis C-methylase UbiE
VRFERLPVVGRIYTVNGSRFPASVRYGDIVDGLPVETASCRGVYASHVLEHLCLDDCRTALRETSRILAQGGIFRLVVPDLRICAERYLVELEQGHDSASHRFMESSGLGVRSRPRTPLGLARRIFGHSSHLWMWDETSLRSELEQAGFTNIRRAQLGDSVDPMFELAEEPDRFVDAVAMEARR